MVFSSVTHSWYVTQITNEVVLVLLMDFYRIIRLKFWYYKINFCTFLPIPESVVDTTGQEYYTVERNGKFNNMHYYESSTNLGKTPNISIIWS